MVSVICVACHMCVAGALGFQTPPQPPATTPDYVLGPEDHVEVRIEKHPEWSSDYTVAPDGTINFPVAGRIVVSQKTVPQLESLLAKKYAARLENPEITVTLTQFRPQRVFVLGDARQPGIIDVKAGWHIAEVLGAAGGALQGLYPDDVSVTLTRNSQQVASASLSEMQRPGSPENVLIQAGDVLVVQAAPFVQIHIVGRVKAPGVYVMRKDSSDALKVIAQAGGPTDDASLHAVTVTHLNGHTETLDLTNTMNNGKPITLPVLLQGDMVVVPQDLDKFAILGNVKQPGVYPMKDGVVLHLSDAIGLAQGHDTRRARVGRIAILRMEGDKQVREIINFSKFIAKGDATQNPVIVPGMLFTSRRPILQIGH